MNLRKSAIAPVAATLALAAGPAWATGGSYTVAVGGSTAPGTHALSAANNGLSMQFLNNTGTVINVACASVSASGNASSGSGVTAIADVTGSTWASCPFPGGAWIISQVGTWPFHGDMTTVSPAATDVVAGHLHQVRVHVGTPTGICSFDVAGNVGGSVLGRIDGTFDEAGQKLSLAETGFTGNLVLYNVRGCLGQLQNGNRMNLRGDFAVNVPDGPINVVSSP
jgi:hypothetical protein